MSRSRWPAGWPARRACSAASHAGRPPSGPSRLRPDPRMPASSSSSSCPTSANATSRLPCSPSEGSQRLPRGDRALNEPSSDMTELIPLEVPRDLHDAMVAHCLREAPLECCGILAGVAPRVSLFLPLRNAAPIETRATRYFADPQDLIERREDPARAEAEHPGDLPLPSSLGGRPQPDRSQGELLRACPPDHRLASRRRTRRPYSGGSMTPPTRNSPGESSGRTCRAMPREVARTTPADYTAVPIGFSRLWERIRVPCNEP